MTIHLVTFSDESMSRARDLCMESALANGVDSVREWSRDEIKHSNYADKERGLTLELMERGERGGGGWWCWKPYVIHDTMCQIGNGDLIIYADAGIEFIAPVQHIIDRMGHDRPQDDVWLFGNNWEHAHWCKADVIHEVWPQPKPPHQERLARIIELEQAGRTDILETVDAILKGDLPETVLHDIVWHQFGKQCQASVIFFRVSDYSRQFVAEWLKWCLHDGGRLIDDSPSVAPNHPKFREHRHDQAILTTLAYKEGIPLHAWPAVYNRFLGQEFVYSREGYPASDDYPNLYHHHRLRDAEFEALGK